MLLVMTAFVICVLVFVALPFIAGVGLSVLIHGTAAIKDGALPWIVYICVGAFLASMLLDSILDNVIERLLPGNKLAGEALAFVVILWVITMGYTYFFEEYLSALTAAFISALGLLAFIPVIKRSEKKFKHREP